jgi:hypothetical protein
MARPRAAMAARFRCEAAHATAPAGWQAKQHSMPRHPRPHLLTRPPAPTLSAWQAWSVRPCTLPQWWMMMVLARASCGSSQAPKSLTATQMWSLFSLRSQQGVCLPSAPGHVTWQGSGRSALHLVSRKGAPSGARTRRRQAMPGANPNHNQLSRSMWSLMTSAGGGAHTAALHAPPPSRGAHLLHRRDDAAHVPLQPPVQQHRHVEVVRLRRVLGYVWAVPKQVREGELQAVEALAKVVVTAAAGGRSGWVGLVGAAGRPSGPCCKPGQRPQSGIMGHELQGRAARRCAAGLRGGDLSASPQHALASNQRLTCSACSSTCWSCFLGDRI